MHRWQGAFPLFALLATLAGVVTCTALLVIVERSPVPIDPGERWRAIIIYNDLGQDVLVQRCPFPYDRAPCATAYLSSEYLRPMGEVQSTAYVAADNWQRIADSSGQELGCVHLQVGKNEYGRRFNVSTLVPCPHT